MALCGNEIVYINGTQVGNEGQVSITAPLAGPGTCSFTVPYVAVYPAYSKVEVYVNETRRFLGVLNTNAVRYDFVDKGKTQISATSCHFFTRMKAIYGSFHGTLTDVIFNLKGFADYQFADIIPAFLSDTQVGIEANGIYLEEAMNQICGQLGAQWGVDVSSGALVIYKLPESPEATYNITVPFEACGDERRIKSLNYQRGTPPQSRVTVYGRNADYGIYNIMPRTEVIETTLPEYAAERYFPLLDQTTHVLKVVMDRYVTQTSFVSWSGCDMISVADGKIYINDRGNNRIREYDTEERTIRTVAGTGASADPGVSGADMRTEDMNLQDHTIYRMSYDSGLLYWNYYHPDLGSGESRVIYALDPTDSSWSTHKEELLITSSLPGGSEYPYAPVIWIGRDGKHKGFAYEGTLGAGSFSEWVSSTNASAMEALDGSTMNPEDIPTNYNFTAYPGYSLVNYHWQDTDYEITVTYTPDYGGGGGGT